jgi:hypothetical protein
MADKSRAPSLRSVVAITILLLVAVPTFAQSVKLRQTTKQKSEAEPMLTLTRDNVEKESYT